MNSREHLLRHGVRTADLSMNEPIIAPIEGYGIKIRRGIPKVIPEDFWQPPDVERDPEESERPSPREVWIVVVVAIAIMLVICAMIAWAASAQTTQEKSDSIKQCVMDFPHAVMFGIAPPDLHAWLLRCIHSPDPAHELATAVCGQEYEMSQKSDPTVDRKTWMASCEPVINALPSPTPPSDDSTAPPDSQSDDGATFTPDNQL